MNVLERRVAECQARYRGWSYESPWLPVTQAAIDRYAESVADPDPMHVDPAWARVNTPYGGTIAQGLWTTAILVKFLHDSGLPADLMAALETPIGLNYGFDRLRFVEPVPVGSSVRGRIELRSIDIKGPGTVLVRISARVSTDRAERPAVAADWLLALKQADAP